MRDRRRRRPQYTPRLVDTPDGVRKVATSVHQQLGRDTYEAPFEIASVLRAYGVRVISALGDRAAAALHGLSEHQDFRVRATVADELRRHKDVSSIHLLSRLAEDDENAEVKAAASEAVEELRQVAEEIAAEQRAEDARMAEAEEEREPEAAAALLVSGEDAAPDADVRGDADTPSEGDSSADGDGPNAD